MSSGVGTRSITDNTAETVTLGLSDTGNTGADVSDVQTVTYYLDRNIELGQTITTGAVGTALFIGLTIVNRAGATVALDTSVRILVNGSAEVPPAPVSITSGLGVFFIRDYKAEVVTFRLEDVVNNRFSVASTLTVTFTPGRLILSP